MLFLWLGLALFSGFITYRSFVDGSYVRGTFAGFWLILFLLAIWTGFQAPAQGVA